MSALTNYDKFAGIGDEEAAAEEAMAMRRPVVTKLDKGENIVVGGGGWAVAPAPAPEKPLATVVKKAPSAAEQRGGVNYSKWDNFEDSESEGEPNQYVEDDVAATRQLEWKEDAEAARDRQEKTELPPRSRPTPVDATAGGGTGKKWDPSGYGSEGIFFAWAQTAEEVAGGAWILG